MVIVESLRPPLRSSWVVATNGLIILVGLVLVIETSGIVYLVIVGISWVTCPYFEGPVFFFLGVLILLMVMFFLNMTFIYVLGDPILRRVVSFPRSGVDDRYIGRDITDVYRFNFLIRIVFDNVALFSVL